MNFPKKFLWGAATASYQVEGATHLDGRGATVWDKFCRKPGAVWSGHTGDVACDHYRRYRTDVALWKTIGLRAYRFSIAWTRVLPAGTGKVNAKGLAFYDKLVDELLAAGIQPWITLFHWDYPYDLYCRGGWLNRDSADWFAEYTTIVAKKLGDRVKHWMTLNEPQCFIGIGHRDGTHAPGDKHDWPDVLRATHHALLAHGRAVQALRAHAKSKCQIGWAPAGAVKIPASTKAADVQAARREMFAVAPDSYWNNAWWMDPVYLGHYPAQGLKAYAPHLPKIEAGDMKIIGTPVDFCGANIYHGVHIRTGKSGCSEELPYPVGGPLTPLHWPITPDALYWGPKFYHERYGLPIYITENGTPSCDWVARDGHVHDPQRIDYTARYLAELRRGIHDGVDVRGYFHWSIMDNFEWAEGYKYRCGMIHVDYATQKRTLKDSAYWYRDVISSNGENM